MSFFDEINAFLGIAEKAAGDLKLRSEGWRESVEQWSKRSEIEIASRHHIKTENFSSEMEKSIMLKAAEEEHERKNARATELAKDPMLANFYHQTLAEIKSRVGSNPEFDSSSLSSVRIVEEGAMKEAVRLRDLEAELTRQGPEYRKQFEEALALVNLSLIHI